MEMDSVRLFETIKNNNQYTRQAIDIDAELVQALRPVIKKHLAQGVDIRDLEYVSLQTVYDLFLTERLTRGLKPRISEES